MATRQAQAIQKRIATAVQDVLGHTDRDYEFNRDMNGFLLQ